MQFGSASGGIGRLPGVPMLVITVPVLASAAKGATTFVGFTPGKAPWNTPWKDVFGYRYAPFSLPAQFQVGGEFSIDSVTPGGGLLPSGTRVRLAGRGFTPSTAVQIDGVPVDSVAFVGPQAIDVSLGAPADLTGRRVLVRNPGGSLADFYPALSRRFKTDWPTIADGVQPILPQQTYIQAGLGLTNGPGYALQNPTFGPVNVVISYSPNGPHGRSGSGTITLDPGETHVYVPAPQLGTSRVSAYSQTPIRMMTLLPPALPDARGPTGLSVVWDGPKPGCGGFRQPESTTPPCWLGIAGAPPLETRATVRWSQLPTA